MFDHHASYFDVPGSLDDIASAATELGVRASLCYEVSDRDGEKKAMEAVLENERFILRAQQEGSDMLHGMMGLHASFTVSDETLRRCEAHRHGAGYHVHCAEGPADLAHCLKTYGKRIIERFCDAGVLGERTLAVHCVHINRAEMQLLRDTGAMVVHNPESNMGNAVGCGPVLHMLREGVTVGLGTDGYTNDMLESYKVGNIIHKHHLCDPTVAWGEIPGDAVRAQRGHGRALPQGARRRAQARRLRRRDRDRLRPAHAHGRRERQQPHPLWHERPERNAHHLQRQGAHARAGAHGHRRAGAHGRVPRERAAAVDFHQRLSGTAAARYTV